MNWTGYLHYKAKHTDIDSVLTALFVSVLHFSVAGGAQRLIDLTSTDDLSLVSEFEQARTFKNLTLYVPPAKDFEWLDLKEIEIHSLPVSIKFLAFGQIGNNAVTQSFILAAKNAKVTEPPVKRASNRKPVLEVKLAIPDARLIHSSYSGSKTVDEEW